MKMRVLSLSLRGLCVILIAIAAFPLIRSQPVVVSDARQTIVLPPAGREDVNKCAPCWTLCER